MNLRKPVFLLSIIIQWRQWLSDSTGHLGLTSHMTCTCQSGVHSQIACLLPTIWLILRALLKPSRTLTRMGIEYPIYNRPVIKAPEISIVSLPIAIGRQRRTMSSDIHSLKPSSAVPSTKSLQLHNFLIDLDRLHKLQITGLSDSM